MSEQKDKGKWLSDPTAGWETTPDGWAVSPGVPWCAEGLRVDISPTAQVHSAACISDIVMIGSDAKIGPGATVDSLAQIGRGAQISAGARVAPRSILGPNVLIGRDASVGQRAILGAYCNVSEAVRVGAAVAIGPHCVLEFGATIPANSSIGPHARIPAHCKFLADLGEQSGYRHVLVEHPYDGVLFVGGCHAFTLKRARAYWAGKPHREETMLAVNFAEQLLALRAQPKTEE